jgi:hypothetical protein
LFAITPQVLSHPAFSAARLCHRTHGRPPPAPTAEHTAPWAATRMSAAGRCTSHQCRAHLVPIIRTPARHQQVPTGTQAAHIARSCWDRPPHSVAMHQRQNQRARSATAVAASSQQQQSGAGRGLLPPAWPRVALRLALCGATVGTLLDGIHSAVALQVRPSRCSLLDPLALSYQVSGLGFRLPT